MAPKKKAASPLSRKAVLVSVNIKTWTARKLDMRVTDETNRKYRAAKDAGRYNKRLLAGEHLAELNALVSKARHLHYRMTRPWADDGPRILANMLFAKFSDEFRVLKRDFGIAADKFAKAYTSFVDARKGELNGLFNANDYPPAREIRKRFNLDLTVLPFPDAEDFRADLDDDTLADIKAELQTTTQSVLDNAMRDTAEQIVETVGHMAQKLKDYKTGAPGERNIFRDSLVENVRELADLLPAFNLADDPKLTAITKRIKTELCAETADTLREDEKVRVTVQKSADQIVAAVGALFA
jgi:hypothetical protein